MARLGRRPAGSPPRVARRASRGSSQSIPVDELIVADSRLANERLLADRRRGAPGGREGARCAEDDRDPGPARPLHPGAGRAALRAAPAGLRRGRLGDQARLRPRRQRRSSLVFGLPLWIADRPRREADLGRPSLLSRPPSRRRRARVLDAQVPDDVPRRGRAAGRARSRERGRRRALQAPRRPAGHAGRRLSAPLLAGRVPAGAERPARRDEPRRAAAACRCATTACSSPGTVAATSSCPA